MALLSALAGCPRPLLALDSSGPRASVALLGKDDVPHELSLDAKALPSEGLVTAISDLLATHALRAADFAAFAIGIGPGSYTGLRVALSSAKGLALGGQVPLYAYSSLQMLAASAAHHSEIAPGSSVLAVRDALRGSVYAGLYRAGAAGTLGALMPDTLVERDKLQALISAHSTAAPTLVTGDAAAAVAEGWGVPAAEEMPRALLGLIQCADAIAHRRSEDIAALTPNYLRPSLSVPPMAPKK